MTFFEEFEKLRLKTPRLGLQTVQNENSPFCQYTEKSKNCYMTFASYTCQDCMYNHRLFYCTDCNDCAQSVKCQLCYECIDCINCYNCNYSIQCEQAIGCDYCYDCVSCNDCFGCVGLRHKTYHVFNEKFTKEEYFARLSNLKKMSHVQILQLLKPLLLGVPRIAIYGKNNEDSYGNNIHNCKNSFWIFDSFGLHDCYYMYFGDDSRNLYDCTHLGWAELCYEIMSGGNLNDCMFCTGCWFSNNLEYCDCVFNSHDCFGCVGLNHTKYCILNIEYSPEEYSSQIAKIKEQMKKDKIYGKWFESTYPEVITYGF